MEQKKRKISKKVKLSKSFFNKVYVLFGVTLILFALFNIGQTSSISKLFDEKVAEAKEEARPGEIDLVVITTDCSECYDIQAVVSVIESTGVNIVSTKEIEYTSSEAKSLIGQYNIDKVPTVIATGEIDKTRAFVTRFNDMGEKRGDAYVFTQLQPPFVDASTGDVRGKVSLIHLTKADCEDCRDLTPFINQLKDSGIKFEKESTIDFESEEAQSLIVQYEIEKLPTIIMDREAEVYENIQQTWMQLGSVETNGAYVLRTLTPPYYSIEEERTVGLVSLIAIVDKSCEECYDPLIVNRPILQRYGVAVDEEITLDLSEAGELIAKYEIEKLPTLLMKGDVAAYPSLVGAWKSVGTEESDGTFVQRKVEFAGQPYIDLTTGEVVNPAAGG